MKWKAEKTLTIAYGSAEWIGELKVRYWAMQFRAVVVVDSALREFDRISVA